MKVGHIVLTTKCNIKCVYCYNEISSDRAVEDRICLSTYKKTIELFLRQGIKVINLTGGEPLIVQDIESYIEFASSKGLMVCITTNAMVLNAKKIKKYKKLGLSKLAISIDSLDQETNSSIRKGSNSSHIIDMLLLAKGLGVEVSLMCTITSINYNDIAEMILFATKNKIPINLQPVFLDEHAEEKGFLLDIDSNTDSWKRFCNVLRVWGKAYKVESYVEVVINYLATNNVEKQLCNVKNNILVVYPNGKVYPCFFQMDAPLGDMSHDSLEELEMKINVFSNTDIDCYKNECITCGYKWT